MRAVGGERIRPADPSQRRPQIVDFLGVIGQPFVRGPASHVTFGALEKSVVVLGMAVCNPIARAILLELFDRVGCGTRQCILARLPWGSVAHHPDVMVSRN